MKTPATTATASSRCSPAAARRTVIVLASVRNPIREARARSEAPRRSGIIHDRMARFVVQLHDASTLHFDLRLQIGRVLRSWAVPKGPSLDPAVRRLAVAVEDHSLAAGEFEGVHAGAARGTGAVIVWDEGEIEELRDEGEHLSFTLRGSKLAGRFGLTRTGGRQWVLVK